MFITDKGYLNRYEHSLYNSFNVSVDFKMLPMKDRGVDFLYKACQFKEMNICSLHMSQIIH